MWNYFPSKLVDRFRESLAKRGLSVLSLASIEACANRKFSQLVNKLIEKEHDYEFSADDSHAATILGRAQLYYCPAI